MSILIFDSEFDEPKYILKHSFSIYFLPTKMIRAFMSLSHSKSGREENPHSFNRRNFYRFPLKYW